MLKYLLVALLLISACSQQPTSKAEKPNNNNVGITVLTYQEGDKTIEERRIKGFLYSIKVTPLNGKPYYLINADGDNTTLKNGRPKEKIPSWTILSW